MLNFSIPTDKPFFTQRVTLDGADFLLHYSWNMRAGWFLAMDAVGDNGTTTTVFKPRRLLSDRNLLQYITTSARPRGWFGTIDMTGERTPATYESLGTQHRVVYLSEEELAESFARVAL